MIEVRSPAQECPACTSSMPDDAIVVEEWKFVQLKIGSEYQRLVYMECSFCGHFESKTQCRSLGEGI